MIVKRLIRPERLREVPVGFNWVDHRLVSQNFIARCDHRALALYLFLIVVSDVQGLSFYSDAAIGRRLKMDPLELASARRQLIDADLLAWKKPLYQVLSLAPVSTPDVPVGERSGQTQSAGDILRRILEQGGGR
jgi:hypothetical protein